MCITSTARRRSLDIKILPSMLLGATSEAKPSAAAAAAETQSSSPPIKLVNVPAPVHHRHNGANPQVVQHDYHDHAADLTVDPKTIKHKAKGGVITPFPVKLHSMLDMIEADGLAHVVSWQPHGRCFVVHKTKEFVNHVMPKYFKQTKMASFQRQLNLYGFNRLTGGIDKGGYYHELFLRGKVSLAFDIHRMRVKGTGVRLPTNPEKEPNFYTFPPISNNMVAALPTSQPSMPVNKQEEKDIVFFEGCPFHYLDPSSLPPVPPLVTSSFDVLDTPTRPAAERKAYGKTSSVVSDSDSEDMPYVPSFSTSNMDWEGPLSSPTLQAHMRRTSFRSFAKDAAIGRPSSIEEDIDNFFQSLEMPVDRYHVAIENMSEDDDTAFGFLLEQAISE
mmetsp:Transcript_4733/g.6899  ORF Transcript_4733/g.6899 Transcript_4733/m.6899 type:complete len:389 (-) Transcript_4733:79-1245(-)